MQVFKIEKPILALALLATADGNNFNELSADVAKANGTVELINDGLARVSFMGRTYDLPIGYVLVLDGDNRLISKAQFDSEYTSADVNEQINDLVARLNKVEAVLSKSSRSKTEPKKANGSDNV